MAVNAQAQREKIERMMTAMAKEQAKLLLAERVEQRKQQREAAKAKAKERAALFRSADAHRKIVLGGLVIAAEVDGWDPAEIVGALLVVNEQLAQQPERRAHLRKKGIEHLDAREAARKAAKQ
ncbi:conjugal transfer protein TraD [Stenotrophomonas acidaminiphila]|uniref:conjugal transfer protein TraD n=1 Tax=Stenotrophomonas acidaminiphila TaxID=128780 RepID=UPI0028A7EC26|nr:conjugal transfer protein TraD [Stenotrophomonas acidaminiphila]